MSFKNKFVPVFVLLVAVLLVFGLAAQARPAPAPAAPDGLVVSRVISQAEQDAALAFWTRKAIASAQPMELPVQYGPAAVDVSALSLAEAFSPPGSVAAGASDPNSELVAQSAYSLDWLALEESLGEIAAPDGAVGVEDVAAADAPTGTGQVYTSYRVNTISALQKLYPHKWIGRLSFSTPDGTSYCSATSISGNVMLTAAHCLYESTGNDWYSNWVFTPAYRNGNAPYGTFAASQCWVLTAWVNLSGGFSINGWTRHDVGVCKMGKNSAGQTLNSAVGWMGRQWNASYTKHVHNLGYPFRNYNNDLITDAGKYLVTCVAETWQQTTETRGMGCNWGGGISGGPWMVNYAPNVVSGNATGVNSGIYIGTQNIYSARFNSNNIVPLCNAAGC